MGSLNDVKNFDQHKPFIPSAVADDGGEHQEMQDPNLGSPNYRNNRESTYVEDTNEAGEALERQEKIVINDDNKNKNISINVNGTGKRKKADFSSLPEDPRESLGIDKKTSVKEEIFKPNGAFDEMRQRVINEYKEDMATVEHHKALESQEKKTDSEFGDFDDDNENNISEVDDIMAQKKKVPVKKTPGIEGVEVVTGLGDAAEMAENDHIRGKKKFVEAVEQDDKINKKSPALTKSGKPKSAEEVELEEGFDDIDDEENDEENTTVESSNDDEYVLSAESDDEEVTDVVSDSEKAEDNNLKFTDSAEEVVDVVEETVPLAIEKDKKAIAKENKKHGATELVDMISKQSMYDDSDSLDDDEFVEDTDDEDDENVEILKSEIAKKINPDANKIDLTKFTISNKGTKSNVMFENEAASVAKWVLPSTGVVIKMKEISGASLELLRADLQTNPPDVRAALRIIYDHIVTPKPMFEMWLKSTAFADYQNLFMALYIASFSDSNYIPLDCPNSKCGKPFLTNNIPIMDMINFKSAETKAKFYELYKSDAVEYKGLYTSALSNVSKDFAIAYKEPSIYSILIEPGYYTGNEKFYSKYTSTIAYLPYIDNIYLIDHNKNILVPMLYNEYTNNTGKTTRSKIQRYDKILNSLSVDEHSLIQAATRDIDKRTVWYDVRIPEMTCPRCGTTIPKSEPRDPSELVFTRNQLGVIASI